MFDFSSLENGSEDIQSLSDWDVEPEGDIAERDLWNLMTGAEAVVRGRPADAAIFGAAPSDDALQELFHEAVQECADEGVFRCIEDFHGAFSREWHATARAEGLGLASPGFGEFAAAVAAELQRRARACRRAAPHRTHPIFANFGH